MKLRILQVEDDPDILEISRVALELVGGHEVFQFAEGREAIRNAAEIAPDVILLDVMMPGMTGEETLAGLRKVRDCETTPAFFMTARATSGDHDELMHRGVLGVLHKPFDPMTLSEQIAGALRDGRGRG
ncbi:MAG: response regulator [Rhodobacteraceae bacterium]|nr:response regulator [Paracoccaceae bacterium]